MIYPVVRVRRGGRPSNRYKGVRMRKWGKWVSEARSHWNRHRIWLGTYNTEKEAAQAYDAAQVCLRGHSCLPNLNFPDDPPLNIPTDIIRFTNSEIQFAAAMHARKGYANGDAVVPVRVEGVEEDAVVPVVPVKVVQVAREVEAAREIEIDLNLHLSL